VNLASTTVLNGVAVLAKIATTLALNKIFAVAIGPAGYAVIGQFQNLVAAVTALTSGAIATGTTKYTAEHRDDRPRQLRVWRTALAMNFIACWPLGRSPTRGCPTPCCGSPARCSFRRSTRC
jgi:PST family polysaccharide transporter